MDKPLELYAATAFSASPTSLADIKAFIKDYPILNQVRFFSGELKFDKYFRAFRFNLQDIEFYDSDICTHFIIKGVHYNLITVEKLSLQESIRGMYSYKVPDICCYVIRLWKDTNSPNSYRRIIGFTKDEFQLLLKAQKEYLEYKYSTILHKLDALRMFESFEFKNPKS